MNTRIPIVAFFLLILFPAVWARNIIPPVVEHTSETSAEVAYSGGELYVKDTVKLHKKQTVNMPKYPRNGYIAIMGGTGLPVGAFAANEGTSAGGVFSISAAFPGVISHCGIAFKFDYGINGFNQSKLLGIVSNNAQFPNIIYSMPNGPGNCSYKTLLTGLYLTYPHKHITIDVRFLMGAMLATIPSLTVNYYDESNWTSGNFYQSATSAAAFAIDFGIEARYPIKPKISAILSIDYLHATPAFTKVTTGDAINPGGNIVEATGQETIMDQPFNIFSFSLGVGYIISAQKPAAYINR